MHQILKHVLMGSHPLIRTELVSYPPTAISDVPHSFMVYLVGFDAIGHLLEVRVMLQGRGEVIVVEEGSPMLGPLINNQHVVGIGLRVDA